MHSAAHQQESMMATHVCQPVQTGGEQEVNILGLACYLITAQAHDRKDHDQTTGMQ